MTPQPRTVVHLLRHGEVYNPQKILYGRLPGYHLSELGRTMAERVAAHLAGEDVVVIATSPLQRAQETAAPIAAELGVEVRDDERLIEADNHFEGQTFGVGDGSLRHPAHWRHMINPFRPSWGESYADQARRMLAAVADARAEARGHQAVLVSHQSPIWVVRLAAEGRHLWHNPRRRRCALASLTSFAFDGDALAWISYAQPAADLLPSASRVAGA